MEYSQYDTNGGVINEDVRAKPFVRKYRGPESSRCSVLIGTDVLGQELLHGVGAQLAAPNPKISITIPVLILG